LADFISMQASMERVAASAARGAPGGGCAQVVEKYGDTFHPKRENWETIRGEITFEDVSFRYPDGDEDF
jgi:ATP-binding cassette subfamily B protein